MRILQVIPHLSKGGAERVVVELANSLADKGHDVTLLLAYPVDASLNQKNLKSAVHIEFISSEPSNRVIFYALLPVWTMRRWKTLRSYDVIHCHLTFGLIFGFLLSVLRRLGRKGQPRLIATCHLVGTGVSPSYRLMNRVLSYFFDAFVLMAQDNYWREFKTKRNRNNIHVVVNGISVNPNRKKDATHGKDRAFTVGTISRLHAERKPWLYLELFSEIVRLDPSGKYAFIIGGEGLERSNLEQRANDLGLAPIITFSGLVEEPNEFLPMLDLYVSLNVEDTTGIAGLEAVFSGLPVVALQLSSEYFHGEDDWIWSSSEPRKLAKKIIELKSHPDLLQDLINRQFDVALTRFSSSRMTDEYLKLYEVRR